MNKLRKILCCIIAVIMILPTVVFAGNDYSWAEDSINYLLSKGVISGDSNGVRPGDNIKRSEFAKIINNLFGFKTPSSKKFADVSESEWYYKDMQIAREAGYFIGDEKGNANPKGFLTRAEACVVYARLLNLDTSDKTLNFRDSSKIPDWSKGAVAALNKSGIIVGYSDNEFKASNNMKRAEVFVTAVRIINYEPKRDTNDALPLNTDGGSTGISYSGSSSTGGSGGGGGGGSSIPQVLPAEFTRINTETLDVSWNVVHGATAYTLRIIRTTGGINSEDTIQTPSVSCNIKDKIDSLTLVNREAKETFKISVKSNLSSSYSADYELSYNYPSVKVPEDMKAISEIADANQEKVFITWSCDSNALSYEISAKLTENGDYTNLTYTVTDGMAKAEIPSEYVAGLKEKHDIKIKGISGNSEILDSVLYETALDMPLFFEGNGSVINPYIVKNVRHFNNIRYKTGSGVEFRIAENLTLPSDYVPFEFSGNIKGTSEDVENLIKLTLSIENNTPYTGLFSKIITGSVSYLQLEGSVKGTEYTGSFAGETGGEIKNCRNNATVNGSKTVGGIAGSVIGGGIEKTINYGDITATQYAGGIVGQQSSGAIKEAANIGNIKATASFIGGIAGYVYTGVELCFNSGNIEGGRCVGGIIGFCAGRNTATKNCYNTGNITVTGADSENIVGGILGSIFIHQTDRRNMEIIDCYNTGDIICPAGTVNPIYPSYTPGNADNWIRAKSCFYLSENGEDDGKDQTTAVTSEELKKVSFDRDGLLAVNPDTLYPYPEIPNLPHIQKTTKLTTPSVSSVEKTEEYVKLTIEGNRNTKDYTVCVYNDEERTEKLGELTTAEGGSYQVVDITDMISGYKNYYITVVANTGSFFYDNSEMLVYVYLHKAECIANPVLSSEILWTDDNGEGYTISWAPINDSKLVSYKVAIHDENGLIKEETIDKTSESYTVYEGDGVSFGGNLYFKLTALGSDILMNSNEESISFNTMYASGSGSSSEPYVITNGRHFDNIRLNAASCFSLENDIELSSDYVPFAFSGELIGSDAENLKTVNVAITGNSGLFTQLSAGKIENIKLTGSVSGGASVGGFAGIIGAASITNCINAAAVAGTGNNIGGIVGESLSGSAKITGCKNEGAVSGNQGVGGISGLFKGQISKCVNNGTVDGGSHYVGGIVGLMNGGGISECYNMNTVTGRKNGGHAAGIVGGTNAATELIMSDCYNTGTIVHTFRTGACGIIGILNTASKVSNCINLTAGLNYPVVSDFHAIRETDVMENCYYISDELTDDGFNNTTALTTEQMKDLTNFNGFDNGIWTVDTSNGYLYPQLINNPHME